MAKAWCLTLAVVAMWSASALAQHPDVAAPDAAGGIQLTPKHLVIVRPGQDAIWGSYVFAVQNNGQEPAALSTEVMLPKETVDFVPQEGIKPEELALSDGGVRVNATFPPGVHIVSIGFKVDARFGATQLSFTPPVAVQSFTLLVPRQSGMKVSAPGLVESVGSESPDPQYQSFVNQGPLAVGDILRIELAGLPEGRHRLWLLGSIAAAVLVLASGLFAWRTRPKLTADERVMVG